MTVESISKGLTDLSVGHSWTMASPNGLTFRVDVRDRYGNSGKRLYLIYRVSNLGTASFRKSFKTPGGAARFLLKRLYR